jgi:hypothetical protein
VTQFVVGDILNSVQAHTLRRWGRETRYVMFIVSDGLDVDRDKESNDKRQVSASSPSTSGIAEPKT